MRRSLCFPSFHELRRARGALVRRATFAASAATLLATLSHAQRFGFPEELVPPALAGQGQPFALFDFDKSGALDLMTAGAPGVLLNDGNGQFTATSAPSAIAGVTTFPSVAPAPSTYANFVVTDVDGDTWADLFGYGAGNTPLLSRNDQVGGFLPGVVPTVPIPALPVGATGVTAIVTGDLDGDGLEDVVLSAAPAFPLMCFRRLTGGGYADVSATTFPMGALISANQLVAADLDGDMDIDLVSAEPLLGGSRRQVFLNDGMGVFLSTGAINTALPTLPTSESFALGDFNGNGAIDGLFVASSAGTATAQTELVLDIAIPAFPGGPFGTAFLTTPTFVAVGSVPTSMMAAVNPLLSPLGPLGVVYLSHPAFGTQRYAFDAAAVLTPVGPNLLVFGNRGLIGDVDVDGDVDFASIHARAAAPRTTRLIFDTPTGPVPLNGTSDLAPFLGATPSPMYAFGDGDGDLDLDLFTASGLIAANNGDGQFGWTASPNGAGSTNTPLLVGDLTGAGFVDTITSTAGVPTVNFSPMTSPGATYPLAMPPTTTAAITRAAKSPSGVDFAVVSGPNVVFFTNFGATGVVVPPTAAPLPFPGTITALAVGDLDVDGDDDIAFGTPNFGGAVYVAVNTGTTAAPVFATPIAISASVPGGTATGANGLVIADIDGNGLPDVIAGSNVYRQTAGGTFAYAATLSTTGAQAAFFPALADVDGDGDLDVLGNNGGAGASFLNNGTGTFGALVGLPAPLANPPAVADVDFDGDPDYVSSTGGVVLNLLRQLALGLPARPGRPFSLQFFHEFGAGTLFNDYWVPSYAPATAPLVGTFLVDPGTAISPVPLAPNVPGAIAPLGAPVAINGDVDTQLVPNVPALVGFTFFTQAGVSRPTFPGLIYLTGRRTVTIRNL